MKITIIEPIPGEEEEIIIKCAALNQRVMDLISELKREDDTKAIHKLQVWLDGKLHLIDPSEVFYFEYVDQKVFVYGKTKVYEIKNKLYKIEEMLSRKDFIRVSKTCILNLNKINSLAPALGGRFEANLKNGEKIIISRQYVNNLKEALGL